MRSPFYPAGIFHRVIFGTVGLFLTAGLLEADQRSCRLVFPGRPNTAPKEAHLFDGTKSHRVSLPSMNLSEVIELPAGDITLVLTPKEINDPGAITDDMPQLQVASAVTTCYLLLLPDPGNEQFPVKWKLVDASEGKIAAGETMWMNFSGHRIVGTLGDAALEIDPHGETISKAPLATSGYYKASFSFQPEGEGKLRPITEQSWWCDTNCRHLGFVMDTGDRLPKLSMFRDFRPPSAPAVDAP